jgi:enoyl-CoA hydratase/carnithine racemase
MPIRTERSEAGVVTLTLDSPERRNALDEELSSQLRDAVRGIAADPGARCVVLTGAGKAFCSGADLGEFRRQDLGGVLPRREMLGAYYRTFLDVRDLAVPTIAAVNGPAIGAGLNLALVCDLRIAGASARFGATFDRLGIHPGGGAVYMLSRLLGPARAAEMLLSGQLVDAPRALEMGLVNRLVDDADLASSAANLAATIAANAPRAVRATKRALRIALDADLVTMLEVEGLAQAATQESADAGEGWAAFRERRAPNFAE